VVSNTRVARILVISQNGALRSGFQDMVASAGHEVIEAADAGVGLVAFEHVPADVVFLDVTGSGRMDAPDFLRRLRRHYPDARVVALAGRRSFAGVDPLAVMAGVGGIRALRAPISREQVLRTLEEVRP
jgi:DNA-binding NtrC family response regulator